MWCFKSSFTYYIVHILLCKNNIAIVIYNSWITNVAIIILNYQYSNVITVMKC